MISGIGVDIVEVRKVKSVIKKWGDGFLKKIFTRKEILYCNSKRFPYIHFASRFAAKEAIAKALGTGFWRKGIKWTDFEITKSDNGKAEVKILNEKLKGIKILVSMSHCKEYAVANVITCRERGPDENCDI